ncbi:glycosyl hydrolase family 8 [Mycolicibacterium sp. 120270]|uniref:glycosyl hydrolase family 8 n=1 Tax=Mycolicibacterium sp. 120270 TaxID=3090600 RepID=UPI00299DA180|nr:glycosyl hydrolase family 8 [Mycolicibacterium sp. 120270]MDX1885110.1 glycosyl hydrolase family 8 [Mycolicibacterium sp. 120270]
MTRLHTGALRALVVVLVAVSGWLVVNTVDPRITEDDVHAMREAAARQAATAFLDEYVEGDGRVVRRDEGGDVVSEGQAYGMLIAAAVDDETRFRAIWDWTKAKMRRSDGLLSWRWADGGVTDANSASDADLDAARALVLAGRRFDAPELTDDGKRLGADILRSESVAVGTKTPPPSDLAPPGEWVIGQGRAIAAGNWGVTPPYTVNPSYFSPRAERELMHATADERWQAVSRTQRTLSWQLTGAGQLPPDRATVTEVGDAVPTGSPPGGPVQFGLDAARLPIRFAESCDPSDRAVAAAMRPTIATAGDVPALRNLDGSPASDWQHPVAIVAAAAAEKSSGDDDAAAARLDQASALQWKYPTYYGSAWVALGRIMLSTSLLGDCPAGGAEFVATG